jgi:hypothetical protein
MFLPIYASNITGDAYFDSLVASGCRTQYFERRQIVYSDMYRGKFCLYLKADNGGGSPPLAPGSGPIAKAYFRVKSNATLGHTIELSVQPMGTYDFQFQYADRTFVPAFMNGGVTIGGIIGDLNQDNVVNPLDVVLLANQVYRGGAPPALPEASDTNCDDLVNPLDVVVLVNHVYKSGPAPCQ